MALCEECGQAEARGFHLRPGLPIRRLCSLCLGKLAASEVHLSMSPDEIEYDETREQIAAEYKRRLEMLRQMGAKVQPEEIRAEDIRSINTDNNVLTTDHLIVGEGTFNPVTGTIHSTMGEEVAAGWRWYAAPPPSLMDAADTAQRAAMLRARIVDALDAEIGDRATAERLAAAMITALEEG